MTMPDSDQNKPDDETRSGFGVKSSPGDENLHGNTKQRLDEKLDEAMGETFPGSDPISVKITK